MAINRGSGMGVDVSAAMVNVSSAPTDIHWVVFGLGSRPFWFLSPGNLPATS